MNPHDRPLFTAAEAAALHAAGGNLEAVARVAAEAVEREVAARLAPIRALADKFDGHAIGRDFFGFPLDSWVPVVRLRAALDAPVSAQQDHDGTEGQGERERADDGDDGFLDYILDRSCPCGPHGEVHP